MRSITNWSSSKRASLIADSLEPTVVCIHLRHFLKSECIYEHCLYTINSVSASNSDFATCVAYLWANYNIY